MGITKFTIGCEKKEEKKTSIKTICRTDKKKNKKKDMGFELEK